MGKDEHSFAWELLRTLKIALAVISTIAIIELVVITYYGFLIYDGQFEYTTESTQDIDNTSLENSQITQN